MRLGIALPTYANDGWRYPASWLERFAQRAESLGFAGIWMAEHLDKPPSRAYSRLDPLVTASVLAGATDHIQIGTSILILPMRNPVLVGSQVASLQHLSEHRFTLGLGTGWAESEFEAVNVPYEERGQRFTEGLSLLRELLQEERVTFDGEFYRVEDFALEPDVSQPPRILVGGGGVKRGDDRVVPEPVKDRILADADGWIAGPRSRSVLEHDWSEIAAYLERNGRNSSELDRVGLNWVNVVPGVDSEMAKYEQRVAYGGKDDVDRLMDDCLTGSVDDIREGLRWYQREGFDQVILGPTSNDPVDVDRQLSLYAEHFDEFLP